MTRRNSRRRLRLRPPGRKPACPEGVTDLLSVQLEREIQLNLSARLDRWERAGWPAMTLLGAEFPLPGRMRADLIFEQFGGTRRRPVVVEIKRGVVRDCAVTQVIRYRDRVDGGAAGNFCRRAEAVLVGESLDDQAARRVSAAARLTFVSLAEFGIESKSPHRLRDLSVKFPRGWDLEERLLPGA